MIGTPFYNGWHDANFSGATIRRAGTPDAQLRLEFELCNPLDSRKWAWKHIDLGKPNSHEERVLRGLLGYTIEKVEEVLADSLSTLIGARVQTYLEEYPGGKSLNVEDVRIFADGDLYLDLSYSAA